MSCFGSKISTLIKIVAPEGRPRMSDVSPLSGISGLSFDATLLSPLVLLRSPVDLSVISFSACWSILLNFFQKNSSEFFVKREAFFMAPV